MPPLPVTETPSAESPLNGNGIGERRDEENVAAAVDLAGRDQRRSGGIILAIGIEHRQIAIELVADIDKAGRIIGGRKGVLGIGRAGAGQSLVRARRCLR